MSIFFSCGVFYGVYCNYDVLLDVDVIFVIFFGWLECWNYFFCRFFFKIFGGDVIFIFFIWEGINFLFKIFISDFSFKWILFVLIEVKKVVN